MNKFKEKPTLSSLVAVLRQSARTVWWIETARSPLFAARVFHLKHKALMDHLMTKGKVFKEVACHMYTIEWQKRGHPHAHILIWLKEPLPAHRVDEFKSAEIPNSQGDPELFRIITKQIVHGPCGSINPSSSCRRKVFAQSDTHLAFWKKHKQEKIDTLTIDVENQKMKDLQVK